MALLSTDKVGFLLDADGDLDVSQGLRYATGLDAIAQGIGSRIKMIRGEWFRDLSLGMPYFENDTVPSAEALLGSKFNEPYARDLYSTAIRSALGVDSLLSLSVSLNASTRVLSVNWRVRTYFGDLTGSTEG